MLKYCHTGMLMSCHTEMLMFFHTEMLMFCYTEMIMLYCNIYVLLYFYMLYPALIHSPGLYHTVKAANINQMFELVLRQ